MKRDKDFTLLPRSRKFGINLVISIVLVLGIIIFLDMLSGNHEKEFDMTQDRRFSLSPQTLDILEHLEDDIEVIAFYPRVDPARGFIIDLLDQYEYASRRKLKYRFIDPIMEPGEAMKYNITDSAPYTKTVLFIYGENQERVNIADDEIFLVGEQKFTNTILKVIYAETKKIYFLVHHGERDIESNDPLGYSIVKEDLEDLNNEVKSLNLLSGADVPDDSSLLIVAGPKMNLLPREIEAIERYFERGGRVMFMADPGIYSNLGSYLRAKGVVLGNDVIIDIYSQVSGGDAFLPFVLYTREHPITEDMMVFSLFPTARTVTVDRRVTEDHSWFFDAIGFSGEQSWAETDLKTSPPEFDEKKDTPGPVPLIAAGEKEISLPTEDGSDWLETEARIVIFGDTDFASNSFYKSQGNRDLFLNAVDWLTGEEELIAIRPRDKRVNPIYLTPEQERWLLIVSIIIMPLFVLATGLTIIFRRPISALITGSKKGGVDDK